MDILIFIIGVVVGFGLAWFLAKKTQILNKSIRFWTHPSPILLRTRLRKDAGLRRAGARQDDEVRKTSSVQDDGGRIQDDIGGDIIEQQAEVKEENLQKIIEALKNQDQITNNEVQYMLGVSDATATRYLDELEKQGIVEQIGATGAGVIYRRK